MIATSTTVITPETQAYVESQMLQDELELVMQLAGKHFPGSRRFEVSLDEGDDEEDSEPRLILRVASDMPGREFREATDRFFAPLRFSGKRIYMLLAVLQRD